MRKVPLKDEKGKIYFLDTMKRLTSLLFLSMTFITELFSASSSKIPDLKVKDSCVYNFNSKGTKKLILECLSVTYSDSNKVSCTKTCMIKVSAIGRNINIGSTSDTKHSGLKVEGGDIKWIQNNINDGESTTVKIILKLNQISDQSFEIKYDGIPICMLGEKYNGNEYIEKMDARLLAEEKVRLEEVKKQQEEDARIAMIVDSLKKRKELADEKAREERSKYLKKKFGKYAWQIEFGQVNIGMTKEMCIEALGHPSDINRTTTAYGTHEQWVYESKYGYKTKYVYFENGKITAIQD